MRKLIVVLVGLLFLCSITAIGFAETPQVAAPKKPEVKTEVIRGKIISIDASKNEIVVRDKAGIEKTIVVDAKTITNLKTDDQVKVTLKEGSNVALGVRKIFKRMTPTKKH